MAHAPDPLPADLLRDVSRSFYLTLRLLPRAVRTQIGLAYLLARTTDTIADTGLVPAAERLDALEFLRRRIAGSAAPPVDFGALASQQGAPAERVLLERCEQSLALLAALPPADLELVRRVLETIAGGQALDLRRFAGASAPQIAALQTDEELDDYTYRVAGCVGEFWTRLCHAHLLPRLSFDGPFSVATGVRFGKGLQLTNILRDLAADLRQGRCYLPRPRLAALGLAPADLLEPANLGRLRPLYDEYLAAAEAHLRAGWAYTNALPWTQPRLRLACALPILIGIETHKLLRAGNPLGSPRPIKISRRDVKRLFRRAVLLYPWAGAWQRMVR
jgi:farnesyl-diphosphate farnesyltransferase